MAIINKKVKYNEFTMEGNIHCIGGKEIFHIWHGITNGWKWYATKVVTQKKIPSIYEGYVEGIESEWGSWYASDMDNNLIEEVPKESWGNVAQFATA